MTTSPQEPGQPEPAGPTDPDGDGPHNPDTAQPDISIPGRDAPLTIDDDPSVADTPVADPDGPADHQA